MRRFDLIQGLGYQVHIVDAVFDEVQSERDHLEELVRSGLIRTLALEGEAITGTVAHLLSLGLGNGESFSFAAAIEFGGAVAIDDRRAVKQALKIAPQIRIFTTADIIVTGIKTQRVSVSEADALKDNWAENHRFRLKFRTFGEFI